MNELSDPGCSRCNLGDLARVNGKRACVPGTGALNARVMLIGEAPGANEETYGQPFIGQAGLILDEALRRAGVPRESIFISNQVKCRPPYNRTPYANEAAACMWWLVREFATVQPEVIVAVGGAALKSLTGLSAVAANRGKVLALLPMYRSGLPVIVTPHPAGALHGGATREQVITQIVADLGFVERLMAARNEEDRGFEVVTPYQTIPDELLTAEAARDIDDGETREAIRKLARADWIAGDLEWEVLADRGLPEGKWPWSQRNGRMPRPVAAGAAARVDGEIVAVSVPVNDGHMSELARGMRWLYEHKPGVFHNATADLIWSVGALGWKTRLGGDTLALASTLNIESSLSLESLASLMTDMPPGWKGRVHARGRGQKDTALIGKMPVLDDEWRRMLEYNAEDCAATVLLNEALLHIAKERGPAYRVYDRIILPATYSLTHAAINGAPIDLERLAEVETKAQVGMQQLVDRIGDELGVTERPESVVLNPTKLGNALARAGVPLPMTPKSGVPSVTTAILTEHKDRHPAIPYILRLSTLKKLESTYLKPWEVMIREQGDRRLHSVYKPTGARTGRTAAETESGGTIQQFPHNAKMRALVRARPGRKILSVDLSAIEMRIAAWFSNDRRMMFFMREGVDMHVVMAAWVKAMQHAEPVDRFIGRIEEWVARRPRVDHLEFANERLAVYQNDLMQFLEVTKDERYYAKPPNFSLIYGGHEQTLIEIAAVDYGITYSWEQAKGIRNGYFLLYEDVEAWHEAQWEAVRRGYTETPLGRRRMIYVTEDESPDDIRRKAINTPVQATANDFAMMAMNECMSVLTDQEACPLIGYIHDSVMFEPVEEVIPTVSRLIIDAFENPRTEEMFGVKIPVPLIAEITVGDVWT